MKVARQKPTGKRSRTATVSAEDDDAHTDDDIRPDETATRPAQAERKRELERNRRNLVNVRFLELEAEIRRCAPRVESPATSAAKPEPTTKCRRIDKEAVLKEAAQRLAVQRKEITTFGDRLTNMTTEIDNLRAEKVELRSDKAYLREELDTVRGDLQRLRSDNIQLWQALKKQSSIKNVLAPDVAKIPAELFLRPKTHDQQTLVPVSTAAVTPNTSAALAALSRQPPAFQSPPVSSQQLSAHRSTQHNPVVSPSSRNVNGDAYLVFQSPEELGELFTSYVPGSLTGFDRAVSAVPTNSSERQSGSDSNTTNIVSQGLAAVNQLAGTQSGFDFVVQHPPPNANTKPPDIAIGSNPDPNDTENHDEDPFSDVAYCV